MTKYGVFILVVSLICAGISIPAQSVNSQASSELNYSVSWVGNSFSGAQDKWVQNKNNHRSLGGFMT